EMAEDREGLRHQRNPSLAAPEALVHGVQAEGWERHRVLVHRVHQSRAPGPAGVGAQESGSPPPRPTIARPQRSLNATLTRRRDGAPLQERHRHPEVSTKDKHERRPWRGFEASANPPSPHPARISGRSAPLARRLPSQAGGGAYEPFIAPAGSRI